MESFTLTWRNTTTLTIVGQVFGKKTRVGFNFVDFVSYARACNIKETCAHKHSSDMLHTCVCVAVHAYIYKYE